MTLDEGLINTITYFVAAACTLGIYTVLYRENRIFRFLEHVFIGVAAGYGLMIAITEVLDPRWWKPMVTENTVVISACDMQNGWIGGTLDEQLKREGDASIRWEPKRAQTLKFTKPPMSWADARYIKLWLHSSVRTQYSIQLAIGTAPERGEKYAWLSTMIPLDFRGWREIMLPLDEFTKQGEPNLKEVRVVELRAPRELQRTDAVIHLDNIRHCIGRKWYWIFALVGGLLYYTIFTPRFAWMSRFIIGLTMGLQSGYTFKAFALIFYPHIERSIRPIYVPGNPLLTFNNIVYIVILLCVLVYFFFSIEHRHAAVRTPARIGRWLLMVTFGLIFGNTVMARFSLFIKRVDFLIDQFPWLK